MKKLVASTEMLLGVVRREESGQFWLKPVDKRERRDTAISDLNGAQDGDLVLAETDWVLRSLYEWTSQEVADAFARLTTVHNLTFENEARLRASLKALREGACFKCFKKDHMSAACPNKKPTPVLAKKDFP